MAELQTRKAGEEQLTEIEVASLRQRFEAESQQRPTLSALAEAAGVDVDTVRDHLRQIRTEKAFQPQVKPKAPDRSSWYWAAVGGVALVVAGGVTYRRLADVQPTQIVYAPVAAPAPLVSPSSADKFRPRNRPQPNFLSSHTDPAVGQAPPGINVLAIVAGKQHTSPHTADKVTPAPYQGQVDAIARAIEELANAASAEAKRFPAQSQDLASPLSDAQQNTFDAKPNQFHYAVKGWAGHLSAELAFPIGARERAEIRRAVEQMFADEKALHDAALGPAPKVGIVSPPPGFRVEFGGRRLDRQEGPKLVFGPMAPSLVQRRLEAALENAVKRDAAPPEGRWTQNAQSERRIPAPNRYAGSIESPYGVVPFDFPAGSPAAVKRGIRDAAAKAASLPPPATAKASGPKDVVIRIGANGTVGN